MWFIISIVYKTGHIGLECINSTSYDGQGGVCGRDGTINDSISIFKCPDSVPYCVQCGPRSIGAALCLSTPDIGNRDCGDDTDNGEVQEEDDMIVCSADAKECSDGSYVGRDPKNDCNFEPCKSSDGEIVDGEKDEPIFCTDDVQECPDGSFVGRDQRNDCNFEPCMNDGGVVDVDISVGCTEDAKVCPDGSAVSRDPMNDCNFKPCEGSDVGVDGGDEQKSVNDASMTAYVPSFIGTTVGTAAAFFILLC